MTSEALNELSRRVLDAAFAMHSELKPGLLESTYVACLLYELRKRGVQVQTEVRVPVIYDGTKLVEVGYRIDMLVQNDLILEIKAIDGIGPIQKAQLLTYVNHSGRRLGLLLNFNEPMLKNGLCRMADRL